MRSVYKLLIILFAFMQLNSKSQQQNLDSLIITLPLIQNDSQRLANLIDITKLYLNTDLTKAIEYGQQSIKLSLKLNDTTSYAFAIFHSGSAYTEMGLYKQALDYLSEAKEIFKQKNNTNKLIDTEINIGNIFWFKEDYKMALKIYKNALKLSEQANNFKRHAILMNMAISHSNIHQLDSATLLFREVNKIINQTTDYFGISLTYLNIGSTFLKHQKLDSALYYLNKSMQYKSNLPDIIKTNLHGSLAQCYSLLGDLKKSKNHLDSCRLYAFSNKSLLALDEYYKTKFEIDTTSKQYKSGVNSLLKLMQLKDTLNNKDQEERFNNYKAVYELKLKEQEISNLKTENSIIKINEKKKRLIIFLLSVLIFMGVILSFIYRRLYKTKADSILHLSELNTKLYVQQEELAAKNEELEQTLGKLKDTQEQLIQSEKLASLGILSAGVAHEINNPLNYINGGLLFLEELKHKATFDQKSLEKFEQSIKMINDGITKANTVVKTLSQFAFKKESETKPENVNSIIDNVLEKVAFKIKENISVHKVLKQVPLLVCDSSKIETIFTQLISNAIDATINNSTEKKEVSIKSFVSKISDVEYITISVANTGGHIEKDHFSKVFDPFFTTKDPDKGYGLGLSITYNLVKELNGNIMVQNKNNGVEFLIMFPILKN